MPNPSLDLLKASPYLKLNKLQNNNELSVELDQDIEWLQECAANMASAEASESSQIWTTLRLKKLNNHEFGDHLKILGEARYEIYTACVKCLEPFLSIGEFEIEACALNLTLENHRLIEDQDMVVCDQGELPIFFLEPNNEFNFKDLFKEQLILKMPPFPKCEADCKGLCQECGANLNLNECSHRPKKQLN